MFNKQHVLMFRYRGRSSTPNIEDLQEVIDITDPMNLRYGNPNLKPSLIIILLSIIESLYRNLCVAILLICIIQVH